MSSTVKVVLLVLLCVAQLTASGWSIARYESVLRSGVLYRIESAPIDPADAFRGRFVQVGPSISIPRPVTRETEELLDRIQSGDKGYAVLRTDADGFAGIAQILPEPPVEGDYLQVAGVWQQWPRDPEPGQPGTPGRYIVRFAFDRYYMNEAAAPAAEARHWEAIRRNSASRAWLAVRVKDGTGVIEGFFIDGKRIEDLLAPSSQ